MSEEVSSNNLKILTGSNTYFAVRDFRKGNDIFNYWTNGLISNKDPDLSVLLQLSSFDYLIIENNFTNKKILSNLGEYDVLFSNDIGLVAKHK